MVIDEIEQRFSNGYLIRLKHIRHRKVRWSNQLIGASADLTVPQRRMCYFITNWVNDNYKRLNLEDEANWWGLMVEMKLRDLGLICFNNKRRTFEEVKELKNKKMYLVGRDADGKAAREAVQWIKDIYCDCTGTRKKYVLVISKNILKHLVNVRRNFTTIDTGTAMQFTSKGSQQLYELCCRYSGKFRYKGGEGEHKYKMNVLPLSVREFRSMMVLTELPPMAGQKDHVHNRQCWKRKQRC